MAPHDVLMEHEKHVIFVTVTLKREEVRMLVFIEFVLQEKTADVLPLRDNTRPVRECAPLKTVKIVWTMLQLSSCSLYLARRIFARLGPVEVQPISNDISLRAQTMKRLIVQVSRTFCYFLLNCSLFMLICLPERPALRKLSACVFTITAENGWRTRLNVLEVGLRKKITQEKVPIPEELLILFVTYIIVIT